MHTGRAFYDLQRAILMPGLTRVRVSKHHPSRAGKGRCRIGSASGLRKLMRAARRGKVPEDLIFKITEAMQSAVNRPARYYGGAPARRRMQEVA